MIDQLSRRSLMLSAAGSAAFAGAALISPALAQSMPSADSPRGSGGRLSTKYRFDDPDMDFFFVAVLGWGPTGGLSVGQAFHVASQIKDGDADSWVAAFTAYGDYCTAQADEWSKRGWHTQSGQMRLDAFASYRSAWQFAAPGKPFEAIYAKQRAAFAPALKQLGIPATFFSAPYKGKSLPGVHIAGSNPKAPVVLLIGGADTGFEDIFFTVGRNLWDYGYTVVMADLPGQGITMADDLHWEVETEKPVSAIVDVMIDRFGAVPGRIAMLGYSLGGYFATRTAGYEHRLGAVIASTPLWNVKELAVAQTKARLASNRVSTATKRNLEVFAWKAGASDQRDLLARMSQLVVPDPSIVTVPFLSIAGEGEHPLSVEQARTWTRDIRSKRKDLVLLPAATGADGHVQANNRLRLTQEIAGWLSDVMPA